MKILAPITAVVLLTLAAASATAQQVLTPAPRTADGITFLTGGIGIDEREAMQRQAADYNLRLTFATEPWGAYLGAVNVRIADGAGRTLLQTQSDGPWFFAQLPAGTYTVVAENNGQEQSQRIEIGNARPAIVVLRWRSGTRSR